MKKLILIFILAVITTFSTFGQCETRKYISSAQKIFDHKLSSSDFSNEILFLTIMEEKNTKAAKLIKNELINDVEWYMLRYKLLKELHNHETNIRSEVNKNQQYFAYLLKSRLSENEFDSLIEKELLPNAVSLFRNILVSDILQVNLFNLLKIEINKSNRINNKRSYSS